MKRLLSIIGAISLIGTSTTSLVACNTAPQYTEEQLKEQKEKHKIDTNNQQIRDNLEWIAPQEKPFNTVDNKYYYVVWRGDKNNNWRIINFKNDIDLNSISLKRKLDHWKQYDLFVSPKGLVIHRYDINSNGNWWKINNDYFKAVYRWNLDTNKPDLIIDDKGNVKVNGE